MSSNATTDPKKNAIACLAGFLTLAAIILLMFWPSLDPNRVVFSNDGPLGVANSDSLSLPSSFTGFWMDLYWIGGNGAHTPAAVTSFIRFILGPVGYSKFYAAVAVLISGLCGWAFFRSLGLRAGLATVAALGAALNSNFFSNTCWGLGTRSITLGCTFLALAALNARRLGHPWLNAILAGFAVGMGVVEGADNGVIFSLGVAAFVLWQAWVGRDRPDATSTAGSSPAEAGGAPEPGTMSRLLGGGVRLALVAIFAGFMATQSLISLFDIASKTAVTATADAETKEQKWSFASQWSLPPDETIRVLIPGLYGYRMDSPNGANYWGRVGESPGAPGSRFSGAGEYAGVLVVLLSLWSLGQSIRRRGGPFTDRERMMMWFWGATLVIATVLAWGKYTPLYRLTVYQLPYFSSIRNPMKFMHVSHLALMVLFGYGLLGLSRRYLSAPGTATASASATSAGGRSGAGAGRSAAGPTGAGPGATGGTGAGGDQVWRWVFIGLLAISVLALLAYLSNKPALIKHLESVGFDNPQLPSAAAIAAFSGGEFGLFVLFMALSVGVLLAILKGWLGGRRAFLGTFLLGLVLTVDLWRADKPWIVYWDYKYKYATNPVLDILRDKPYEARVVAPSQLSDPRALQQAGGLSYLFPQLYAIEWVQHHFQYYNIQSIDVAQDPRPPADKMAYLQAMRDLGRYWQLTNTRYILGMTGFLGALNQQVDHGLNRFRVKETFTVVPKPGGNPTQLLDFTVQPATNAPLALFEYTGALPRAKLFGRWLVATNGDEALKTLTDPSFDPWSAVVISDDIPASPSVSTNADAGTVAITSYAPKRLELKADAKSPAVLLLNDRFDRDWRVTVDDKPARLLRANFIMRGVELPAGAHTVRFEFQPSLKGLKVSLVAIGLSVVLSALLFFVRQDESA